MIARRCGRLAGCALAAALVPMAALAQAARRGPLEVREEFLLAQPRLTLPSVSPDPLPAGETRLALGLDWASDFALKGAEPNLTHFVDGEHRTLAIDLRRGITPRVTLGLRVPVRWRGAGVLDGLIDGWHRVTGLPDNDRGLYPRNQFVIEGRDALGGGELEIGDETGTGLGNVELSGLWALRRGPQGLAVSLIARAELPTGTGPFEGTGAHAGAQAVAAHPLGRSVDVYFGAGATFFAREDRDDLDYARWRAHGFVTLEWRAARTLSLLIETGAASRLIENIADYPGLQMYFRMGAKLDLGQHWRLEGGFLEGVVSIQATTRLRPPGGSRPAFLKRPREANIGRRLKRGTGGESIGAEAYNGPWTPTASSYWSWTTSGTSARSCATSSSTTATRWTRRWMGAMRSTRSGRGSRTWSCWTS